jgi:hypothetical protein
MKIILLALCLAACPLAALGQSKKPAAPPHPNEPATEQVETETIGPTSPAPNVPAAHAEASGYMEPTQVKALTHKLWLAEYRLNDLLSQVKPDKWNMSPVTRKSFAQTVDSLHTTLAGLEDWRSQFENRPDSLYLGFQTYVAISALLPRVDGVARGVSQYENASLGAQYSQSGNQFFDLQQSIQPHLSYLLKNQDNMMTAAQSNLASCQNELNYAERNKEGRATPMKNIAPEFRGHGRPAHAAAPAGAAKPAGTKGDSSAKQAASPPNSGPRN